MFRYSARLLSRAATCSLVALYLACTGLATGSVQAALVMELEVDISGWQTDAFGLGESGNSSATFTLDADAQILSVDYTINFDALAPSQLGEFVLVIENSGATLVDGFWQHRPTGNNFASGNFSGSGSFTTTDSSPNFEPGGPFSLLGDGILRVGVVETFPDAGVSPDARVNSGILTIRYQTVPEPGIFGIGLWMSGLLFHRHRHTVAAITL